MTTDPLDTLRADFPIDPPRPAFVAGLRDRLRRTLGASDITIPLPTRRNAMTTATSSSRTTGATTITPYLCVADGAAAIDFYRGAFGATEVMRFAEDSGKIGHAELSLGDVSIYLSDEYPEHGVVSPTTLGGSPLTLYVTVADVDDVFARAIAQGAEGLEPPADAADGDRRGTLRDPFGHRWTVAQPVEQVAGDELAHRYDELGFTVTERVAPAPPRASGGIWAAINSADAMAMIRFVIDVLGFEEEIVVPGDEPGVVVHSQLRWPEGGVIQVGSSDRAASPYSERAVGQQSLYVITADPMAVHERCVAAGVEIVTEPVSPEYDPGGVTFGIRDHEGNLWSFGTYAGG